MSASSRATARAVALAAAAGLAVSAVPLTVAYVAGHTPHVAPSSSHATRAARVAPPAPVTPVPSLAGGIVAEAVRVPARVDLPDSWPCGQGEASTCVASPADAPEVWEPVAGAPRACFTYVGSRLMVCGPDAVPVAW